MKDHRQEVGLEGNDTGGRLVRETEITEYNLVIGGCAKRYSGFRVLLSHMMVKREFLSRHKLTTIK